MSTTEEAYEEEGFGEVSVWEGSFREDKECFHCGEEIKEGAKVRFKQGYGLCHNKCAREYIQ
jgi:hypothetical protein